MLKIIKKIIDWVDSWFEIDRSMESHSFKKGCVTYGKQNLKSKAEVENG